MPEQGEGHQEAQRLGSLELALREAEDSAYLPHTSAPYARRLLDKVLAALEQVEASGLSGDQVPSFKDRITPLTYAVRRLEIRDPIKHAQYALSAKQPNGAGAREWVQLAQDKLAEYRDKLLPEDVERFERQLVELERQA